MRIMVTNDDGIDSVGLHVLARAVASYGDVTVVAPDSEYSGAGAAIGALWQAQHEVERVGGAVILDRTDQLHLHLLLLHAA